MFYCDLLNTNFPMKLFHPVLLPLPLFTSRYPRCNIYFSKMLNLPLFHNKSYKPHMVIQKAVTYYLTTYSRRTVSLGKWWILISLIKVQFGYAVLVAIVQLSPVRCVQPVFWSVCTYSQFCVCCDIPAGLIRPPNLYATCYMGLLLMFRHGINFYMWWY